MAAAFGVSIVSLKNTLNVFLIGYAVGQFFGGSFSDQVGRKRVGYSGLVLYIIASLGVALARDVDQMLVLRFLQAIGGGFSTVICMASVRDVYPIERARPAVRDNHDGRARGAAGGAGARRVPAAVRLGDDLRCQGELRRNSARSVRAARARDAPRTLARPVRALHIPAKLGSRDAQGRRAAVADSVRARDGPLDERAHGVRNECIVRVHGVLRSCPGPLSAAVRAQRHRLHVDESLQHAEPQQQQRAGVLSPRARGPDRSRYGVARDCDRRRDVALDRRAGVRRDDVDSRGGRPGGLCSLHGVISSGSPAAHPPSIRR